MSYTRLKTFLSVVNVPVRRKSVWIGDNIVKSWSKDVEIPKMTMDQFMFKNLEKWATKTATVCEITNRNYTYEQVYKKSRVLAANLKKKFNIRDGDVISVVLPNVPEFPIVTFGILAAGGVVTTLNPVYTAYEIHRQLELSDAKLIITIEDIIPTIKEALNLWKKDLPIITLNLTKQPEGTVSLQELIEDVYVDLDILKDVRRSDEDVAFLPYSSGTTGLPKGVQLTNRNVVANCEQQNTEFRQYRYTTETHQDNLLLILPLFHSYALSICMLHKMSQGVKIVTLPKFKPDTFLDALLKHKIHLLYLAPPMVLFLGSHPKVTAKHLETITNITCGAAPLPVADVDRLFDKAERNLQFCQGYGMTETSPLVSVSLDGSTAFGDVGYCLPNQELRIVDANMKNLGPNEVGELLVKGPNVMKGYLRNPEANKDVFVDDVWLRTGDLVRIDETGRITVADRLKELIKIKGFQVPPAELENVLKEHPSILDAAVIGVPDNLTGERPKAFVVLHDGAIASDSEIKEFISKRVAPYKKINDVVFLDAIPKSPSGKILRKDLM